LAAKQEQKGYAMQKLLEMRGSRKPLAADHMDRCDLLLLEVQATDPAVQTLAEAVRILRDDRDTHEREQALETKEAIADLADHEQKTRELLDDLQGILETVIKKLDPDTIDSTPLRSIAAHVRSAHDLVDQALARIEGGVIESEEKRLLVTRSPVTNNS